MGWRWCTRGAPPAGGARERGACVGVRRGGGHGSRGSAHAYVTAYAWALVAPCGFSPAPRVETEWPPPLGVLHPMKYTSRLWDAGVIRRGCHVRPRCGRVVAPGAQHPSCPFGGVGMGGGMAA